MSNKKINLQKELDLITKSLDVMKLSNGEYIEDINIYEDLIQYKKTINAYPIIPLTYNLTILKLLNLLPEDKKPTNKEFANYLNLNEKSIGLFQYDTLNKFIKTEGVNGTTFPTLLSNLTFYMYNSKDIEKTVNNYFDNLIKNHYLVNEEGQYFEERGSSFNSALEECFIKYQSHRDEKNEFHEYGKEYIYNKLSDLIDKDSLEYLSIINNKMFDINNNVYKIFVFNDLIESNEINKNNYKNIINNCKYKTTTSVRKYDIKKFDGYISYIVENNVNVEKINKFISNINDKINVRDYSYDKISRTLRESINDSIKLENLDNIKEKYISDFEDL